MNIEVTKNTTIFCRSEAKTIKYIGPQEFRVFGHEFEKAYTIARLAAALNITESSRTALVI